MRAATRTYGWMLFVLVAVTGVLPGVALLVAPDLLDELVGWFGHELPSGVVGTASATALARWIGTVLLGGNVLTLVIAVGPFRRGERWAWAAFWYWPAMFGSHALIYDGTARIPQVVWAVVTAGVLALARPQAPAGTNVEGSTPQVPVGT